RSQPEEDRRVRRPLADAGDRARPGDRLRQGLADRPLRHGPRPHPEGGGAEAGLRRRGRVRPRRRSEEDGPSLRGKELRQRCGKPFPPFSPFFYGCGGSENGRVPDFSNDFRFRQIGKTVENGEKRSKNGETRIFGCAVPSARGVANQRKRSEERRVGKEWRYWR